MTVKEIREYIPAFSDSRPKKAALSAVEALMSKWDVLLFSADRTVHKVNFIYTRSGNILLTLRLNRSLKCFWQANY